MVNIRSACFAAIVLALSACAAPTPNAASLSRRQAASEPPLSGPHTSTQRTVLKVAKGQIVSDCEVTFEPIKVNAQNQVLKTERCTRVFVPDGAPVPPPPATTSQPPPASTPGSAPPASTPNLPPPTTPAPPPSDTTTVPAEPPATSAPAGDSSNPPPQQPADPSAPPQGQPTNTPPTGGDTATAPAGGQVSESKATDLPTGGQDGPTNAPVGGGAPTTSDGSRSASSTTAPLADNTTTTGTRANTEASQSAAAQVKVPGKSIEVLPIGLGVFAGISVIAMIVVGLTTYERTKYRKAFRQRRLAASGAEMGYGGMSERR